MGFELILELRTVFMNAIHACTSKTAYFWIHTDPFIENAGKLWNCLGSLNSKISFEYSEQFVLHTTVK